LLRWSAENRSRGVAAPATGGDAESLALQDRLESALRQLSPTCRAVLLLHRKEGMTPRHGVLRAAAARTESRHLWFAAAAAIVVGLAL
jgi:hypothetical protein